MTRPTRSVKRDIKATAERIYRAYLPSYLKESWKGGRGKFFEDWLKKQLELLVTSEIYDDPERLDYLNDMEGEAALVFGLFATAFRILDHIGMHLRAQTLGQYELWVEDNELLTLLCHKFLSSRRKNGAHAFKGIDLI